MSPPFGLNLPQGDLNLFCENHDSVRLCSIKFSLSRFVYDMCSKIL
jgi:hypothetical protein